MTTTTSTHLRYQVSFTQKGNGVILWRFDSYDAAERFTKKEWAMNREHPDFMRGGDDRGAWSVDLVTCDEEGEIIDSQRMIELCADLRKIRLFCS